MCSYGVLSDSPGMGQVYEGRGGEGGGDKRWRNYELFSNLVQWYFFFPLKCDKC